MMNIRERETKKGSRREKKRGSVEHVFCGVENTCLLKRRGIFFFFSFFFLSEDKTKASCDIYI
jgi:hypothetical protein